MSRRIVIEFELDEGHDDIGADALHEMGDRIASEMGADLGAVLTYMGTTVRGTRLTYMGATVTTGPPVSGEHP